MTDSGIPYPDPRSLDQTGAIVLKLMKDFIGKCWTVYADNFNNSVNLTKQISSNCRYICETLRADRKIIPDKFFGRKLERERKWKWKDKNGKIKVCKFKYAKKTDLESILLPQDNGNQNPEEPYINKHQKHIACSYGYKLVYVDDNFSKPFKTANMRRKYILTKNL